MTTTQTEPSASSRIIRAISLLVDLIRAKPRFSEAKHKDTFQKAIMEDENKEYLDALIDEWLQIKYSTALGIAVPPTRDELRASRTEREETRKSAEKEIKQVTQIIAARLLDFAMPNGKPLRDCTGKECAKAGGWLTKVAAALKPNQKVGAVLDEDQVRTIFESQR